MARYVVLAVTALGALALFVAGRAPAGAQGILLPRRDPRETPFSVRQVRISAAVTDAVAETTVQQTFANDSSVEQEGTYLFPLPDGATVTSCSLRAGDRVIEGRILTREEARGIYESIVRQRRDPALLEYADRGLFRASVFPIPPHGEREFTLKYYELLKPEGGVRQYSYPLSTGRYSVRPARVTAVSLKVRTTAPLRTVYSPTHDVSVRRPDDRTALASWEGGGQFPDRDFCVYFGTGEKVVGLTALACPTGGDGGFFVLIAAPGAASARTTQPKQIVFVLDRTGSMQAEGKMDQARKALNYCLDHLNPEDRFGIVAFNEGTDLLSPALLTASHASVEKAHQFVNDLDASGGTNIAEAVASGLRLVRSSGDRQQMLVLITDGQPTIGETDPNTIVRLAREQNPDNRRRADRQAAASPRQARLFCFGVGHDVNVAMLDRLAEDARGDADYVRPGEDIASTVTVFYDKVASPVLVDPHLTFDGIETRDVLPAALPDIFAGGQIVVAGRYRGAGSGTVRLTGTRDGREVSYTLAGGFGHDAPHSSLAPRIWATRKIGALVEAARLHADREVVDEIIRLSREYGIVTPYTSYLADERIDAGRPQPVPMAAGGYALQPRDMAAQASEALRRAGEASGASALDLSINARAMRRADRTPSAVQNAPAYIGGALGGGRGSIGLDYAGVSEGRQSGLQEPGYRQVQRSAVSQVAAGRAFHRTGGIWFDNGYRSGTRVVQVRAASDAHLQLLRARPDLSAYAAVGDEVVIAVGKVAVQIGAKGKEKLTDAELRELTAK